MGYKDSFVDEFPYLVYSDDPSAVNGAGGDSVAVEFETGESTYVYNESTRTGFPVFVMADPDGSKYLANATLPVSSSPSNPSGMTVSKKAYIGLLTQMVGMFNVSGLIGTTGDIIEPVGTHEGTTPLTIFECEPYDSIHIRDAS